ncbi:hypothetical protein T492DRAFT_1003306 [Pavlovales sp. CCMP2436]|nr:hypothetical protein T492DRAFT_1003306 [Pavlovales sp. CCMP2436]
MAPAASEPPWRLLFTLRELAHPGSLAARGLPRTAVRIESGPQVARTPHPTDVAIAEVWDGRLAANPRLFDAPKYRLASSFATGGECALRIGLTRYRDYIGTHLSSEFARLVSDGERDFGDGNAHLGCALGVETVLLTADQHIVLLRRSTAVATSTGEYNGPSGHPEPNLAVGGLDATPEAIRDQLWDAVIQETFEETGVPTDSLGEPLLIGAMADERRKPDLLFCTTTSLRSDEVMARYRAGAKDAWESSGLIAVPPAIDRRAPGDCRWNSHALGIQLTAVTQAAMVCMKVRDELMLNEPD